MPIFTYVCEKCCEKEDRLVSQAERETQLCEQCQSKMQELFPDSFNFSLKGNWYKNTKSY
jgi:putative FmdB family regulatory protein